jgi:acetyl-CoA acetyltransferase
MAGIGPETSTSSSSDTDAGAEVIHLAEKLRRRRPGGPRRRRRLEIDGSLPVNTDGGLIANGEPIGGRVASGHESWQPAAGGHWQCRDAEGGTRSSTAAGTAGVSILSV